MRCVQKQNERGNTQILVVFFVGMFIAIGGYSLWKVGIEGGNTLVVTANSNKEHIAAVVSADVLKAREVKKHDAKVVQKKEAEKRVQENTINQNINAEANALQALRSAQKALEGTLLEAQQILSDTLHTQQAKQKRISIGGPWDNFWWRGDMPGENDPTPGVNKMYFAPIQGVGGGGGGAAAPASSPSSSAGGGSIGGGAPSGGPPSGPPGAGPL